MMVDSSTCTRLDLEPAAPHRRVDTECRRDRRSPLGPGRLRRAQIEFRWTDDANWRKRHGLIPRCLLFVLTRPRLRKPSVHLGREGPTPAPLLSMTCAMSAISAAVSDNVAASNQPSTWR